MDTYVLFKKVPTECISDLSTVPACRIMRPVWLALVLSVVNGASVGPVVHQLASIAPANASEAAWREYLRAGIRSGLRNQRVCPAKTFTIMDLQPVGSRRGDVCRKSWPLYSEEVWACPIGCTKVQPTMLTNVIGMLLPANKHERMYCAAAQRASACRIMVQPIDRTGADILPQLSTDERGSEAWLGGSTAQSEGGLTRWTTDGV
jgi:hypothetical protein